MSKRAEDLPPSWRQGARAGAGGATTWAEAGEKVRRFAADRVAHFSRGLSRTDGEGSSRSPRSARIARVFSRMARWSTSTIRSADCARRERPLIWNERTRGERLDALTDRLEPEGPRPRSEMVVPIVGPGLARGLFTVTSAEDEETWAEHGRLLKPWPHVFGGEFHRSVTTLLARSDREWITIPPREVAALRSAAD